MSVDVSIIICCHNSASVIDATLSAIEKLDVRGMCIEIILVDNLSSDGTHELLLKWAGKTKMIANVVLEGTLGLNCARKRGVEESKGKFLVFCDDDNHLDPNYVQTLNALFLQYETVGIIGGWSQALFETEQPVWFKNFEGAYAVGGRPDSEIAEVNFVFGSGMSIRRQVAFDIFSQEFTTKDRRGKDLTSGGDAEICEKCLSLGFRIIKASQLRFIHFIKGEKLTWTYCIRLYKGFGFSAMMRNAKRVHLKTRLSIIKELFLFQFRYPFTIPHILLRTEGSMFVAQFYSLWGTFRAIWFGSL